MFVEVLHRRPCNTSQLQLKTTSIFLCVCARVCVTERGNPATSKQVKKKKKERRGRTRNGVATLTNIATDEDADAAAV